MRRAKSRHHFYHPKKLYKGKGNNVKKWLNAKLHAEYHGFFDHFCRNVETRPCHRGCRFGPMCCYYMSDISYGRRLK